MFETEQPMLQHSIVCQLGKLERLLLLLLLLLLARMLIFPWAPTLDLAEWRARSFALMDGREPKFIIIAL